MRDKREPSSRQPSHRGSRAIHDYDEKMPRHKPKVVGPQEGRDREFLLPKHRPMAIRPHERERDRDIMSYYPGRSSRSIKLMSPEEAQKAIRTLFIQVKETISFFASFKEEFQHQVRGIEAYANNDILDALWVRKAKKSGSKGRSSKDRSKEDGVGTLPEFDDVSRRLWDSLNDAHEGALSHRSDQNDSIAKKLEAALQDVGRLLKSARNKFEQVDSLIKELKVLKLVLELGEAGTASHDERAKQRYRTHTASHGPPRDSSPGVEDARSGRMEEDSGDEDSGRHDEQYDEHLDRSGGREEREFGGDEDGDSQGPFSTDHSVYLTTNMK